MKVKRDNKLKLGAFEKRVGNFVIKYESTHMKVMDIGQVFTHRADKLTPVGMFLESCYKKLGTDENTGKGLANWMAVMFTVFSVVPDVDFLTAVMDASKACMERHPEAYGMPKQDVTDEEDARIIKEEREIAEFEEEVNGKAGKKK